jgi:transcriptional regulator with XRE-family HTH domain
MKEPIDPSRTAAPGAAHVARRVRALRAERGLTLEALAQASGVSRSMISLVERGEANPTAVVLERLATGLGVMLADLFGSGGAALRAASAPGTGPRAAPLARAADQPVWRDPASGYRRRNVSPAGASVPTQIVEVEFPPGARVAFETTARAAPVLQQVWLLAGAMHVTLGRRQHRLAPGDCLAMVLDQPIMFHNPGRTPARYAVVITQPSP